MFKYLAALSLFCLSLPVFASDSNDHWLEIHSPHFLVLTDSNEKQGRRIAGEFEQMRSVFHTLLPAAKDDAGSPIIVLALKDRKGFQALEPAAYLAKGQLNLAGFFLSAPDKHFVLLRLDAEGEHPFATVYHEYTHYLLRKADWLPLWLNEGMAEFYQNTDIRDKDVLLGQPSSNDILFLRQSRMIPLTTLLQVDHNSPYYHDEQKGSIFYSESWALTHYIIVTDRQKKTDHLHDYAVLLSHKGDPVLSAQTVFGDLKQLQRSLDSYVGQGDFSMFKMNIAFPSDSAGFTVRPVAKPEIDAIRADVLADNGRTKEAEALLTASLHDDPSNALAHEVMGSLRFRENDIAGAKRWYGEAVQLDSHSYLAQYYFAVMTMDAGGNSEDAAIESSLRSAIKLNPAYAPAYDALAMFYASRDKKLDEAHHLNLMAIELEPEKLNYRLNAAAVLSQQRLYPGAIGVLTFATRVANGPEETAMLKTRIQQLERFQAALKQSNEKGAATEVTMVTSVESPGTKGEILPAGKTVVFKRVDGKMGGVTEDRPTYPAGDAKGPTHSVRGVLRHVRCSDPSVLALTVEEGGKTVELYSNNFYKIVFTTVNYEPAGDLKPCTDVEDMKALVKYAEVSDKAVAGQILSIDLSK